MAESGNRAGDELLIVDNSDQEWKTLAYLHEWADIARALDVASGYFEIGALLALDGQWQKIDKIRILMGDEATPRTRRALLANLTQRATTKLDESIEGEKEKNDFLKGVPAILDGLASGKIECRVYAKQKFHAKAYIMHARSRVVGSAALVGSSNFTLPGLTQNVELNVQLRREVDQLQQWYDAHWEQGEDISSEILKIIQRHVAEYAPFEVYARALRELMRNHIPDVTEWEKTQSKVFPVLAKYQQDGYASLFQIAKKYRGAFLCDGVGLGKTFVGMMVIERLLHDRQKVVLLAPRATVDPVWRASLQQHLPGAFGQWSGLRMFAHTDLGRTGWTESGESWDEVWEDVRRNADVILIDEAHHFRNPGTMGREGKRPSRYRKLFDVCAGKQMFLLTATPINNSLRDLQHMMELFSRAQSDYFGASLGIQSLPTHFGNLEKELEKQARKQGVAAIPAMHTLVAGETVMSSEVPPETDEVEAEIVLRDDPIFAQLVVQNSRAYARASQLKEARARGGAGAVAKLFPDREDPRVAEYELKKTYGRLLQMVETAFDKDPPLFNLAIYYPLFYLKAPLAGIDPREQNRQQQVIALIRTNFLKRFESSTCAFETSCCRLLLKLLAWVNQHGAIGAETKLLNNWRRDHIDVLDYVEKIIPTPADSEEDDSEPELDEDDPLKLTREHYKMDEIFVDCINDLNQIGEFLREFKKFKPQHDDKLRALKDLLKKPLKDKKVLIFTQYADTAKYVQNQLREAGVTDVDEVDSSDKRDRGEVIRRFAPYYNGSSSPEIKAKGWAETRVLISTDVLSEGLNLQDATRLINYDLHWNPVRLMQRIGRVDRRMNPAIEGRIVADNSRLAGERGDNNTVAFWNFLPPDELDSLLRLYKRVAHKTLRISKTFGVQGGKLLTPDDPYDDVRDILHLIDPPPSSLEQLSLEWQDLTLADADLVTKLDALPGRLFSGKKHSDPGSRAVFFCYVLPTRETTKAEGEQWTYEGGQVLWLLFDLASREVLDSAARIAECIRCKPSTPRRASGEEQTLGEIRREVETKLRNSHERALGAPPSHRALLRCWMELS